MQTKFPLITVLGPTAAGKTTFAANLAYEIDAEIISADSRQVYRGMDIGTGKDLGDYTVNGSAIPYHLIDIADAGSEYSVFQFQRDFEAARSQIISKGKTPLMCGGTGMYLEGYQFIEAPVDEYFRKRISLLPDAELIRMLKKMKSLHNTTDIIDRERLIRAIEIEDFRLRNKNSSPVKGLLNTPVIGIRFDRILQRQKITARLTQRLNEGMIDEVRNLLKKGISEERLKLYGLEYKFIAMYLSGELKYDQMFTLLNTAIHQFAKRQMTWFRRMQKSGIRIFWLEGEDGSESNLDKAKNYLESF